MSLCQPMILYQLLYTFLLNRMLSVECVIIRNLSSSLPAHFLLVDCYSPCNISCSVLGYAYGVMDTAVSWIMKNANSDEKVCKTPHLNVCLETTMSIAQNHPCSCYVHCPLSRTFDQFTRIHHHRVASIDPPPE